MLRSCNDRARCWSCTCNCSATLPTACLPSPSYSVWACHSSTSQFSHSTLTGHSLWTAPRLVFGWAVDTCIERCHIMIGSVELFAVIVYYLYFTEVHEANAMSTGCIVGTVWNWSQTYSQCQGHHWCKQQMTNYLLLCLYAVFVVVNFNCLLLIHIVLILYLAVVLVLFARPSKSTNSKRSTW